MSFTQANILTTREDIFGSKQGGQIVPVPSGRLDKVALYLEPVISDTALAQSVMVVVSVCALDIFGKPDGPPIVFDSRPLSDITVRGFVNFRLSAAVPSPVGIVLRVDGGDADNHVAWRYLNTDPSTEEMLISMDAGSSWTQVTSRKFSYKAFSFVNGAISTDDQTATIRPGTAEQTMDHLNADWTNSAYEPILNKTAVDGDTVIVNFGNFVVTLVVDQSGSMTWNDNAGLRYTFLKQFVADIESSLPAGSTATYSLFKFKGRKIGKLTIGVQGSQSTGLHLDGVRIVRKEITSSPPYNDVPTGINDGLVLFEGLAERYTDNGSVYPLVPGTSYGYAAFPYAILGNNPYYSDGRTDYGVLTTPVATPYSVAGLASKVELTTNAGVVLLDTDTDLGYRKVTLTWKNPSGLNYNSVILVRRPDRLAASPSDLLDGGVVLLDGSSSNVSYVDSFGGTYEFVNGLTYYYSLFTVNSIGIKSLIQNVQQTTAGIPVAARPWEQLQPPIVIPPGFPVTPPVKHVANLEVSNGEIRISWTSTGVRYKLYVGDTRFPLPLDDKGTSYDGTLLYDGTDTVFTHRSLKNGQPYFYTIIALDRVGNASLPEEPLVGSEPPRPSATSTVYLPPDPVTGFSSEVAVGQIDLTWTNPKGVAPSTPFYFGDVVEIVSNVEYLDQGNSESFITYEFVEVARSVSPIGSASVDAATAIRFASVPSLNADSIASTVSVTPSLAVQNQMESASITVKAVLRVKHRETGNILAEVETNELQITLQNPFTLSVTNEPAQNVSRREWKQQSGDIQGPCTEMAWSETSVPGVYVLSNNPFFALMEASYRGASLGAPLNVAVSLLDPVTGEPSALMVLPQTNTTTATLAIPEVTDEVVDRSGSPTGETQLRSMLPLTLPSSNISGQVLIQLQGTFQGYSRTVSLTASYEPILNIDLNLLPFQPDGIDITEQSAFVYLAPFDADQSAKVPVPDLTVTNWSIKALCKGARSYNFTTGETGVIGIKSFTRGGIAQKIFWGPGDNVTDEQAYEVTVTAQSNGMTATGHGILTLSPITSGGANKMFLRKQDGFNTDTMYSDGSTSSIWEVLGHPEDDTGPAISSGETFVNSVLTHNGRIPPNGIEDSSIVTLNVMFAGETSAFTSDEIAKILSSVRIKTDLTGTNGKSGSATATMTPDEFNVSKAVFSISVNTRVPQPQETIAEDELQQNTYYGINFTRPLSGVYLVLTAYTAPIDVNGHPTVFIGGGSDLVSSAPPCFIELVEPLRLT